MHTQELEQIRDELERLATDQHRHKDEFRMHIMEDDIREDRLIRAQEQNTANIESLTKATQGLVDAWTAANLLSRFVKWLGSFAVVGTLLVWLNSKFNITNVFGG